jgi:hypothetical protein
MEYFLLCLLKMTTTNNTMIPNSSTTISPPTAPRTIASSCEPDWDWGESGPMSGSVVVLSDVGDSTSVVVEPGSSKPVVVESMACGVVVSAPGVVVAANAV